MSLLVIDGDNISVELFKDKWNNEIKNNNITQKIIYGDFSKNELKTWIDFALQYNFKLEYCPGFKKQTTDFSICIDTMKKLYENNFKKLFLASNDSDFIKLANAWISCNKKVTFICNKKSCSPKIKNNFNTIFLKYNKYKKTNNN